jgi:hypothetical protein
VIVSIDESTSQDYRRGPHESPSLSEAANFKLKPVAAE